MLVAALSVGYVAWHGHHATAFAKGDDGDDNGDDSDDSGGDDKGGDDKGGDDDDTDTNDDDAKTQPPVTAGGLFTLKTYPTNANLRPLTMTQNIAEVKLSLGTDISSKGAFKSIGVSLEGKYGFTDNVTGLAGITSAYNFDQFSFYAGIEGSIIYDLLDFRVAANLQRTALQGYATFCDPPRTPGEQPVGGACMNSGASQDELPDGTFKHGSTQFSIDIGFPFRYAIKPQIAIVALSTLMSIDFNKATNAYLTLVPAASGNTDPTMGPIYDTSIVGNAITPDFNPSLGLAINPIAQVSVVVFGQFRVPDFDFNAQQFQVPVTGRVQVSPNQKMDFGLEFTLLNVKPPDGQSAIDNRFIGLFFALRAGK
jgi:hypothetical protein